MLYSGSCDERLLDDVAAIKNRRIPRFMDEMMLSVCPVPQRDCTTHSRPLEQATTSPWSLLRPPVWMASPDLCSPSSSADMLADEASS